MNLPTLLEPSALQRSVDEALARLKADVPEDMRGAARVRVNTHGATVSVYTRIDIKGVTGEAAGYVDRTWTGDITAGGQIVLRW